MKFINFTIVKFSVFLILGILAGHFFPTSLLFSKILGALFLLLIILFLIARKQLFQNSYFGIVTYCCFFAIGYFSYQIRLPQFQPNHYSHTTIADNSEIIQIEISQVLKPDKFNLKYLADVSAIQGKPVSGKILLHVAKDSLIQTFLPNEILLVYGTISDLPKPLNPYQFDYSAYMKTLGVYGQIRISEKEILKTTQGSPTLQGIAENIRFYIVEKLQKTKLKLDERAIIQALILGEKKDIDKQIYSEYAAAGAVHILAVSGLHVGIIYLILGFLLKSLKKFKYGTYAQSLIIVLCLWAFALISGLSPSVTRAVTMFSFFALAGLLNRPTNSLNTLFLSLLTLLVINPLWLFQVGFQLSYLAVFFIVWLQPKFYKIGYSKYYIVRKIWGMLTVTFCAQLGVLPLSLYYFHQFPGLFLLTNLVILPFLTLLMIGGLLIVFLAILNALPPWLVIAYNYLIEGLNGFIHWVAVQDKFLFKDISFSVWKVMGSYLLVVGLILLWKQINYKRMMACLVFLSLLIGIYIWENFKNSSNELIVFQKTKHTLLVYKNGRSMIVFRNDSTSNLSEREPLKSYKTAMNIESYTEEKLPQIFSYRKKNILIVDSLGVYPNTGNIHTIILIQSPRVNLNRLIDNLKPKQIIADGSNYKTYINRWKETCKLKKLPFSQTAKTGAFQIE